jgi:hypothetical protein
MVPDQSQDTYMSVHVLQALVEVGEHVGELVGADEVGSTRSI